MLPFILAQSATDFTAGQLGAFVGILLLILGVVIAWRQVFSANPPLHKEYATKTDMRDAHGRMKREREEVDAEILRVENEFKARMLRSEERIGATRETIASLQAETTNQTRSLHVLDGKVDRILERLPRA